MYRQLIKGTGNVTCNSDKQNKCRRQQSANTWMNIRGFCGDGNGTLVR